MLLMLLIPTTSFAQATATGGGAITILDVVADRRMNRGQLDSCELVYKLAKDKYFARLIHYKINCDNLSQNWNATHATC